MKKQYKLKHPADFPETLVTKIEEMPNQVQKRAVKHFNSLSRKSRPGILDRISLCESEEAAHLMLHEFLDSANAVSQKTINRAIRLLSTLDFPLP